MVISELPARSPRRAVVYVCVTEELAAGRGGPAGQVTVCLEFAAQHELEVVHIASDPGDSIEILLERPGLREALRLVREGEAGIVLMPPPATTEEAGELRSAIEKQARKAGGQLLSATSIPSIPSTKSTKSTKSLHSQFTALTELQNNLFQERVRQGRLRIAAAGRQPHARAPFGYTIPSQKDVLIGRYPTQDIGKYIVVPEEALIVQFMFNEFLETGCVERVAQALFDAGIKTPKGNARWNFTTLNYLLQNPAYKGEAHFNLYHVIKREGSSRPGRRRTHRQVTTPDEAITIPCPPIVSTEVFDAAQVRRTFFRREGPKSDPSYRCALLRTLLTCAACGSKLASGYYEATKTHDTGFYYACKNCKPTWNAESPRPRWSTYPATVIEEMVRERLIACLPSADAVKIADLLLTSAWHIPHHARHNLLRESGFQGQVLPDPLTVTITFCNHPPEKLPPIVDAFLRRCKRVMVESLRAGLTRNGVTINA